MCGGVRLHPEAGVEASQRSLEPRVEGRLDRNVLESVHDARPLLELEPFGQHTQVERCRVLAFHHAPVHRERRVRRLDAEVVERPATGAVADSPGEFRHREIGRAADP